MDMDNLYRFNATITRVIDGDTVEADVDIKWKGMRDTKSHLRLWGINAPELHSIDPEVKAAAIEAKAALIDLVLGHDIVVQLVEWGDGKDFGRSLVRMYAGDIDVNQTMVDTGHAVPYKRG